MAWTYSDALTYPDTTAAEVSAKLVRLRLFEQELSDAVSKTMGSQAMSVSTENINDLLRQVREDRVRLEALSRSTRGGMSMKARMRRG